MITHHRGGRRPTLVLLHDLWMSHRSLEEWAAYFDQRGYVALTPAWPGLNVGDETSRRDSAPLASLSIADLLAHYAEYLRSLRGPVILMGHGFGGLLVQLLVDRDFGDAGVLIASCPTAGVVSFPRSAFLARGGVVPRDRMGSGLISMPSDRFYREIVHGMDRTNARVIYDRYHAPAPVRILRELAFAPLSPWATTQVNYHNDFRAPLLFLAGGADRMIPPWINRRNAARYAHSDAITSYREWPHRGHFTIGEVGWTEVADYALNWSLCHVSNRVTHDARSARLQPVG